MLKPLLSVAAAGLIGLVLWKILAILLLPLVGTLFGLLFVVLKVAFITGVVCFMIWLFRRMTRHEAHAS
jgi:hypothetical protein